MRADVTVPLTRWSCASFVAEGSCGDPRWPATRAAPRHLWRSGCARYRLLHPEAAAPRRGGALLAPLWNRILRDKEATSLFSKLKRLLSLLLQLALLVLLVLALGDPRAAASLVKGRNLVVLVDASASMQATDVSGTRPGSAKDEVRKMIRGLGGADRMLIAQMDAVTTALVPMSGDTAELERSLDCISATDTRVDFARALRFATDAVRGLERSEIVVVSDGNVGEAADASGAVRLGWTPSSSMFPSVAASETSPSRSSRCAAIRSTKVGTR